MRSDWKAEILRLLAGKCRFYEPLSAHTSFRTGGPADVFASPATEEEFARAVVFARSNHIALTILGRGSNVIVADKGIRGIVCETSGLCGVSVSGRTIRAGAGALLDDAVRAAVSAGLGGMEKLSGIPGSAGGALGMNAGAFGQETGDCFVRLRGLDAQSAPVSLQKKDLSFGYRKSGLPEGLIILSAEWELVPSDRAALENTRREILAARAQKQPLEYPSAGSVFKRPPGNFASKLIEEAGLKGLREGGAQVSEKHAGFIVNTGNAAAADIMKLIETVRRRVKAATGIELELEQIPLGEF